MISTNHQRYRPLHVQYRTFCQLDVTVKGTVLSVNQPVFFCTLIDHFMLMSSSLTFSFHLREEQTKGTKGKDHETTEKECFIKLIKTVTEQLDFVDFGFPKPPKI